MLMAAADFALVQGGFSSCMELAATGTPFLDFPIKRHFEQNVHVACRNSCDARLTTNIIRMPTKAL